MRASLVSILMALYVAIGLVIAGLGVPLTLRRVPPNNLYGFRIPQTLNNPSIWYQANTFAGYMLVASGIVVILVAVGVRRWWPGLSYNRYTLVCTLALVGSIVVSVVLSWLYAQSLTP